MDKAFANFDEYDPYEDSNFESYKAILPNSLPETKNIKSQSTNLDNYDPYAEPQFNFIERQNTNKKIPTASEVAKNIDLYTPQPQKVEKDERGYFRRIFDDAAYSFDQPIENFKKGNYLHGGYQALGATAGLPFIPVGEAITSGWSYLVDAQHKENELIKKRFPNIKDEDLPHVFDWINENIVDPAILNQQQFEKTNPNAAADLSSYLNLTPFILKRIPTNLKRTNSELTPRDYAVEKVASGLNQDSKVFNLDKYLESKGGLIENSGEGIDKLARGLYKHPEALNKLKDYFDQAISSSDNDLKSSLNQNISDHDSLRGYIKDLTDKGREKASPYYKSFHNAEYIGSPKITAILASDLGKKALDLATKRAGDDFLKTQDGSLPNLIKEMKATSNLAANSNFKSIPLSPKLLDYTKRAFEDLIDDSSHPVRGNSILNNRLIDVKNTFLNELDNLDPTAGDYKKARAISGDYLSNKEAALAGKNFLKDARSPDDLNAYYNKLNYPQKQAYKAGIKQAISDRLGNSTSDVSFVNALSTDNMQNALKKVLGSKEQQNIQDNLNRIKYLSYKKQDLLRGSNTANKIDSANVYNDYKNILGEKVDALKNIPLSKIGLGKTIIENGYGKVKNILDKNIDTKNAEVANNVADIILRTSEEDKRKILNELEARSVKEPEIKKLQNKVLIKIQKRANAGLATLGGLSKYQLENNKKDNKQ